MGIGRGGRLGDANISAKWGNCDISKVTFNSKAFYYRTQSVMILIFVALFVCRYLYSCIGIYWPQFGS